MYREGNAVADSLANYAIDEEISGTFEEFHQLPAQARKLINVDKAQIPSFRVKILHLWICLSTDSFICKILLSGGDMFYHP